MTLSKAAPRKRMGLRSNRRPGNRAQTVAERKRTDAVKRGGCLCCIAKGFEPDMDNPPAVDGHHLTSASLRLGHEFMVGLCVWHHAGRLYVEGWDIDMHRDNLGPSLAEGSKPFNEAFGSDEFLLEWQNERLGVLA